MWKFIKEMKWWNRTLIIVGFFVFLITLVYTGQLSWLSGLFGKG